MSRLRRARPPARALRRPASGRPFQQTGTEFNITNCTFADNQADGEGGGLYLEETVTAPLEDPVHTEIASSIFWGNTDPTGDVAKAQIHVVEIGEPDVTVRHCDVEGEELPPNVIDWGGNIHQNPMFASRPEGNYRLQNNSPCIDVGCNTTIPPDLIDINEDTVLDEPIPFDLDASDRMQIGDPGTPAGVDMGAYEFAGSPCPWDCQEIPNGAVDVPDFLTILAQWGQECVSCDFAVGAPGVDTAEFLAYLANFGPCPSSFSLPPETNEQVLAEAGLTHPEDWETFVAAMIDPELSEQDKANWRCWMEHYLDCHTQPVCFECAFHSCPDTDPYGYPLHFP